MPVERERESNEWNKGGQQKYASCNRWLGDVASAYVVITKNRRNTVTIAGYHGMSQQCDSTKISEPPTVAMEKYMSKKKYKYERTTSPLHPRYLQKKYQRIQECHMDKKPYLANK